MTFLTDGTVSLRPVERSDLGQLAKWRNDSELRVRTREFRPLNMLDQERWFERITGPQSRDHMLVVTVPGFEPIEDDSVHQTFREIQNPIGVVGLCYWSPRDATAELSLYVGDEQSRQKGYMRRALMLLHKWGFEELGLARIYADTIAAETNLPLIGLLKKLGYQEEGRLRKHVYRNGKRWDSVMLGLLKEEWGSQDAV